MAAKPLTSEFVNHLRENFYQNPKNIVAQNVCTRFDPFEACISRKRLQNTSHVYNIKVDSEAKPVTQQKASGRCWIFAALNVIRLPFMKKHNIEDFEFSQGYLFFWDKIERAHYFLNTAVETARRGEKLDGQLVSFLLKDPVNDGGQWDMLVSLINKYGLMPKKCFPEAYSMEASFRMNGILRTKLREFCRDLRKAVADDKSDVEIQELITIQMTTIYKVVSICLGIPDEKFTWEYNTAKTKEYNSIGPVTPLEFYQNHVKPIFNVDDKVCLVSDPRPGNPFGNLYTVDCLGNVVGGRRTQYNNQPIELLMKVSVESLRAGEAVWFGCEVSKRFNAKHGIEDLEIHDFKLMFDTEVHVGMDKADRLLYGDSCMTHAMVFTAVSTDGEGNPTKYRVENSYGDDKYDRGYLTMTTPWFREFVFEVVCDKKFVPKEVLAVFDQEPIVLPAWDPMGTLAS